MPTPIPPGFRVTVAAPEDAIAAFQRRKLLEVTFSWMDIWGEEHRLAFTVSRLAETALLDFVRSELDQAIANGTDFRDWAATVRSRFIQAGWWGQQEVIETPTGEIHTTSFTPRRLQLIFDTNVRQAYSSGRAARIERSKDVLPLLIYRTRADERVRESHQAWDGVVLPVDHPWWDTHWPMCGWGCRCRVYALDEASVAKLQRAGLRIQREAPPAELRDFVNKRTGQTVRVPLGVDPGFGIRPRGGQRVVPE